MFPSIFNYKKYLVLFSLRFYLTIVWCEMVAVFYSTDGRFWIESKLIKLVFGSMTNQTPQSLQRAVAELAA